MDFADRKQLHPFPPPYFANISKRLTKSPKLYFYDTGLAANLLGIEEVRQIETHPLRGSLFENLVISEVMKQRFNKGKRPNLSFFRDAKSHEVDLLYHQANEIIPIEFKSATTVRSDFFKSINYFNKQIYPSEKRIPACDGNHNEELSSSIATNIIPKRHTDSLSFNQFIALLHIRILADHQNPAI